MLILNFAHPLTGRQLQQIEELTGQAIEKIDQIDSQVDTGQPLILQMRAMVEQVELSPAAWQTVPLVVNLPSLNFITAALLAELHGRCGYFPAIVRLRPLQGSVPPRFEVIEIINLQTVRDEARTRRSYEQKA